MPTQRFRESIPLTSTLEIDLGPLKILPPNGGRVRLFAVGTADGSHRASLLIGTDLVIDRAFLNPPSAAGVVDVQRDAIGEGYGEGGDPLTLRIENTTGAAAIAQGLVVVD